MREHLFSLRLPPALRRRLAAVQRRHEHLSSLTAVILLTIERGLAVLETDEQS